MKLDDVIPLDSPATCTLMVLILVGSCYGFYNRRFFLAAIAHPYSVRHQRQFYRALTGDLVSNDPVHLILNEYMLSFFGGNLEEELNRRFTHGSLLFLFVYGCSLLFGFVYTTMRYQNDFEYSSAGASGSIMGCVIGFMMLKPDQIACYLPIVGGLQNKYDALIVIAVLTVYQKKSGNPMINNELHFFGAVGGIVATALLIYVKF